MKNKYEHITIGFIVYCGVMVLSAETAFAYLDPGTGSMILQGILGGMAAAAVLGRLFWQRILKFFGIKKDDPAENMQLVDNPEYSDKKSCTVPLKPRKQD